MAAFDVVNERVPKGSEGLTNPKVERDANAAREKEQYALQLAEQLKGTKGFHDACERARKCTEERMAAEKALY
jgi:hypothetical protein